MMNESEPVFGELPGKLPDITLQRFPTNVDKRIETEDEVDRVIRNHFQAVPAVEMIADLRVRAEPGPACIHALRIGINQMQVLTMVFQVITPATKPRPELKDCVGRQGEMN